MLKKLLVLAAVVAIIFGGLFALSKSPYGEDAKVSAANAALNDLGLKNTVSDAVANNKTKIASYLGVASSQVDAMVAALDVDSWNATKLPSDAVAVKTLSGTYAGQDVTMTLYRDPGYATVEAAGTSLTLSVPSSARSYITQLESN